MKSLLLSLLIVFLSGCSTFPKDAFPGQKGCYLLFNMKTQEIVKETGTTCRERFVASSTFKVPLAIMAFDSGVLKSPEETYKWNGVKHEIGGWNSDQNARTWMKQSVVWFSQELTPKIGEERIQKYLKDFRYGNQDLKGGLKHAWLHSPSKTEPSLKISPYEQMEFMNALWSNKLPVSPRALEITKELIFIETTPGGFRFSGKTGSNSYATKDVQLGWFIAHVSKGEEEYIAVMNFSDLRPSAEKNYGGPRARAKMIALLKHQKLW